MTRFGGSGEGDVEAAQSQGKNLVCFQKPIINEYFLRSHNSASGSLSYRNICTCTKKKKKAYLRIFSAASFKMASTAKNGATKHTSGRPC